MPKPAHVCLALFLLLLAPVVVRSQSTADHASQRVVAGPAAAGDRYLWLEELASPRSMEWVKGHNAASLATLEADSRYATFYSEALAIAEAQDRIPGPRFVNGEIHNFWRDARHPRGVWRKTTLADYQTATPAWTTILDIDALGKSEGKSWVNRGAECLGPDTHRCMVSLSDGGEDAVEMREFDLDRGQFVEGGFRLPRAKQSIAWEDPDHLLIARELAPGDTTPSGYPYVVTRLARGQPLEAAREVYRGVRTADVSVRPIGFYDETDRLMLVVRYLDFFHSETYVLSGDRLQRLAIPPKAAVVDLVAGRVIVRLREPWTTDGQSFAEGSLVQLDLAAVRSDPEHPRPRVIWTPGERESLRGVRSTRGKLLVATLDNVRGRAWVFSPAVDGGWQRSLLELPDNMAIGFAAMDDLSDTALLNVSGFLTPDSLWRADAATGAIKPIKSLPAKFDGAPHVVEQFEAAAPDGTKIPYFVVHRRDIRYDGSTPTLIRAYGGFETSWLPLYSASTGKLWLERGGALVIANIRGGGEFGPRWHEAAMFTRRQVAYDDFVAVAKGLIDRKITSPRRLGIEGGSNGGLLTGVQFTQHPELWNAVVISVPLLDMIRISTIAAGASWQGEYGDVNADPEIMAFWMKTSPYHNLKPGIAYPEPFLFTTTKDDRVGPQHARKFAARLEEMKLPFLYYENTEGGHGSGADHRQESRTLALTMTYLHRKLMD
jgi:prolyl oligopeptidase